jgi:hypothetical protein
MLGECSTKCHHVMWSFEMSYLEDIPCMGMVRKLLRVCVHLQVHWTLQQLFQYTALFPIFHWIEREALISSSLCDYKTRCF